MDYLHESRMWNIFMRALQLTSLCGVRKLQRAHTLTGQQRGPMLKPRIGPFRRGHSSERAPLLRAGGHNSKASYVKPAQP